MRIVPLLLAPLALLAAACGAGDPPAGGAGERTGQAPPPASPAQQIYEANATVLDDGERGPMLCLGGIALSLPPQCGDVPVTGWDWTAVEGEEKASGTTWGMYHVVGLFDGKTFAVTEAQLLEDGFGDGMTVPDFTSPCTEPAGGWPGLDAVTQNEAGPVHAYARSQPEYVTSWVTHLGPRPSEFSPVVVNVVFTKDAERHEAEMRKIWEGPLCVVERDVPSARELARIRREAEGALAGLGLQMLWSTGPAVEAVIEIGVVADFGGKGQAAFDERYGEGLIRLVPALKPIT